VLELGGVRNVLAKSLGTTNPINMAKATVVALQSLRRPEDVARIRGKQISEVLPLPKLARTEPVVAAAVAPATRDALEETALAADVPGVAAADAPATGDVHEETALAPDAPSETAEPTGEPEPVADASLVSKPKASGQSEPKPKRSLRKKKDA
jgi:ribosomal S5-like protein